MKRLLVSVKLNPFILHEYKRAHRCKTRHMDRKSHHLRMSTYACKHVSGAWGRGVVYLVERRGHTLWGRGRHIWRWAIMPMGWLKTGGFRTHARRSHFHIYRSWRHPKHQRQQRSVLNNQDGQYCCKDHVQFLILSRYTGKPFFYK